MAHNEDTRVKIPAILHLCRLGYKYLSLKDSIWDEETNIFPQIFEKSIQRINKRTNTEVSKEDVKQLLDKISLLLDNEDLEKSFMNCSFQMT
jgi:type I restriction enzyme R subunit